MPFVEVGVMGSGALPRIPSWADGAVRFFGERADLPAVSTRFGTRGTCTDARRCAGARDCAGSRTD